LNFLFNQASNEARSAFGDGRCFIERFVHNPRHIEVQILGDGSGNVVHLFDRDCSVQRRHQKVVEMAPATGLPESTRLAILNDAVRLTSAVKYKNAGTVEFLVDEEGRHYFCEVNPRVQVEHTVTEEVTGIDIVQSQIMIAAGKSLEELGLTQDTIKTSGFAMQCRVTTEDPSQDFRPDTGGRLLCFHALLSTNFLWTEDVGTHSDLHTSPPFIVAPITIQLLMYSECQQVWVSGWMTGQVSLVRRSRHTTTHFC